MAVLLALVLLYWSHSTDHQQTKHFGDDQEYLTVVYSLLRHGSPEFVTGDDAAMLWHLPRSWRKSLVRKFKPAEAPYGYYRALDGRYYGWHFFTYPAFVAPMRAALGERYDSYRAHHYFNLIAVSLALLSIFQLRERLSLALGLALLAAATPVVWFLPYAHTEPFVFALGLLTITFYMRERTHAAVGCTALAATQFQPLAPIAWFMVAEWLWKHRTALRLQATRRRMLLRAVALVSLACVVFAPGLFYFSRFGTPNLIAREGLASLSLLSGSKLLWMFLDPNGGMLAYTPGLLLLTLWAAGRCGLRIARGARDDLWGLGILACALFEMYASTCQRNWNHPTLGVSRYVVYTIAPLLFFLTRELLAKERAWETGVCVSAALALQLVVHVENGYFAYRANDAAHHSRLAKYVLSHWPGLYSPPPEVFCERTLQRCPLDANANPAGELYPIIWRDGSGRARKVLTDCNSAHTLERQTWTPEERATLERALAPCTGSTPKYVAL